MSDLLRFIDECEKRVILLGEHNFICVLVIFILCYMEVMFMIPSYSDFYLFIGNRIGACVLVLSALIQNKEFW